MNTITSKIWAFVRALALLAMLAVIAPWLLVSVARAQFGGPAPWSGVLPIDEWRISTVRSALTDRLSESTIADIVIRVSLLVAWAAIAVVLITVIVEMVHMIRHGGLAMPEVRGLRLSQPVARVIAAGLLVLVPAFTSPSRAVAHDPPLRLPEGRPPAAALARPDHGPAAGPALDVLASGRSAGSTSAGAPAADPAQDGSDAAASSAPDAVPAQYVVKPGDSIYSIAGRMVDGDERAIAAYADEMLDLNLGRPMVDGRVFTNAALIDVGWILELPGGAAAATVTAPAHPVHVVEPGESLWSIADDELGDGQRWSELFEANRDRSFTDGRRLTDPDLILPGWELALPVADAEPVVTAQPSDVGSPPPSDGSSVPPDVVTDPLEPPEPIADTAPASTTDTTPASASVVGDVVTDGSGRGPGTPGQTTDHRPDNAWIDDEDVGTLAGGADDTADDPTAGSDDAGLSGSVPTTPQEREPAGPSSPSASAVPRAGADVTRTEPARPAGSSEAGGAHDTADDPTAGRDGAGAPGSVPTAPEEHEPADPSSPSASAVPRAGADVTPTEPALPAGSSGPTANAAGASSPSTVPTSSDPVVADASLHDGFEAATDRDVPTRVGAVPEQSGVELITFERAAMLSAGVLTLLAVRRRSRFRRARPHTRLPEPARSDVATERALRSIGAGDRFARVDIAIRNAALPLIERGQRVEAVTIAEDGELGLTASGPVDLPAPWERIEDGDGVRWRLAASVPVELLVDAARRVGAPCPTLIQLGRDLDDRDVYVDLEALGVIEVGGPGDQADAVVAAVAASLATSVLAEVTTLVGVGVPDEAFFGHRLHRPVRDVQQAFVTASEAIGSTAVADRSTFELRARVTSGEAWEPAVVLAGSAVGTVTPPVARTGLAVVSASPVHGPSSRLAPDGDAWALRPLGLHFVPIGLARDDVAALASLTSVPEPIPEPVEHILDLGRRSVAAPDDDRTMPPSAYEDDSDAGVAPHVDAEPGAVEPGLDDRPEPEVHGSDVEELGAEVREGHVAEELGAEVREDDDVVDVRPADGEGEVVEDHVEADGEATTSPLPYSLVVRLFGPVSVESADGTPVEFERSKTRELIAWLVTHRERSTRSNARAALWELDVRDATFSNVVSEARRAMARRVEPPAGEEWVGRTMTDALPLHELVVSDLDLVEHALASARLQPPDQAIETLRSALPWVAGVPFEGTSYLWPDAEGITSQLVLRAMTLTSSLADHCLSVGDIDGVFDATSRGLRVIPAHEDMIAARMSAYARIGDRAGVRHEWESYERAITADPWSDGEPSDRMLDLRRDLMS